MRAFPARSPRIRHRNELTERDWENAVQGLDKKVPTVTRWLVILSLVTSDVFDTVAQLDDETGEVLSQRNIHDDDDDNGKPYLKKMHQPFYSILMNRNSPLRFIRTTLYSTKERTFSS